MRISDRIFGAVVILGSFIYVMAARGIAKPFFADPLGPQAFPIGVGIVAAICGLVMVFSPDEEPDWPEMRSFLSIVGSTILLIAYAYALKPMGFLVPTAIASAVISYQITPAPMRAVIYGFSISVGLFVLFKFALGLSLFAFPRDFFG
jgi:putative tricarboxylic transport membrane protein